MTFVKELVVVCAVSARDRLLAAIGGKLRARLWRREELLKRN